MALKACKECRKEISSDANPCPHCGKKNPHGMSALMKYGGGFLAVMFGLPVMAGFCAAVAAGTKTASSTSTANAAEAPAQAELVTAAPAAAPAPAQALAVSAVDLWREYDANEVAADDSYKGRKLAVTGTVASIDKGPFGGITVRLTTPNQFQSAMASMEDSETRAAASLSKRTRVTVVCDGGGMIMGSPVLRDCTFQR